MQQVVEPINATLAQVQSNSSQFDAACATASHPHTCADSLRLKSILMFVRVRDWDSVWYSQKLADPSMIVSRFISENAPIFRAWSDSVKEK
jgi:hypothetical protein